MPKKKKKDDLMTTQEMIARLQKHGLNGDATTPKDILWMITVMLITVLIAAGIMWLGK